MNILIFALISFGAFGQTAHAAEEWCIEKQAQYSKVPYQWLGCDATQFGLPPVSTGFQASHKSEVTQKLKRFEGLSPEEQNKLDTFEQNKDALAENKKRWELYSTQKNKDSPFEISLASKFIASVESKHLSQDDETLASALVYLKNKYGETGEKDIARTNAALWEGECLQMATWTSVDELKSLFHLINNQMVCEGKTYERGELKELMTMLSGIIPMVASTYPTVIARVSHTASDELEAKLATQANQALNSLGVLGVAQGKPSAVQENTRPENIFSFLKSANEDEGKSAIIEVSPLESVWNHSIYKVLEAKYRVNGDSKAVLESLSLSNLKDNGNPIYHSILSQLEKDLISYAVSGSQNIDNEGLLKIRICRSYTDLGGASPSFCTNSESLRIDVLAKEFKKLKVAAVNSGKLLPVNNSLSMERREIKVIYGYEVNYLSNRDVISSRTYTSEMIKESDTGTILQSSWTMPENAKADRFLFDEIKTFNPKESEMIFGEKKASAYSTPAELQASKQKKDAYIVLRDFIDSCKFSNGGAVSVGEVNSFFKDLSAAFTNNHIDESERQALKASYKKYGKYIPEGNLNATFNAHSRVEGALSLREELLAL